MRKFIFIVAMLFSAVAMAEELKIGAINAAKVLDEAPQADAARLMLEKEFAPRNRELISIQEKLQSLEEKMARDSAIMSDEQRRALDREILTQRRDVKRFQEEFRDDLNMRRNEEFSKLQRKIAEAIGNIAEEKGYDLILGEGVIYAGPKVDLSNELVSRLKTEFEKISK